jgi:HK97 family phage major capsid protein
MDPQELIKSILDGLTPEISKSIKAEIEAMGLDKADRAHNVNAEMDANKSVDSMDYKERTVRLVKAMAERDSTQIKVLSEGVAAGGGELVPYDFASELIDLIVNLGFLRGKCKVVPVGTDSGQYPAVSGGVTTYWKAENTAYTASDPGFTHIPWVIHKLTGLSSITEELNDDNIVNVYDYLLMTFGREMGRAEDQAILNGTGVGALEPLGILQTPGVVSGSQTLAQTGAHIGLSDLLACKYRLPQLIRDNPGSLMWLYGPAVGADMEGMVDQIGRPLFRSDITGDRPSTLLSYPHRESEKMPAGTLMLVDLSWYYLFDRRQMAFKVSDQTLDAFTNDLIYLKCSERFDGRLMHPTAASVITSVTA